LLREAASCVGDAEEAEIVISSETTLGEAIEAALRRLDEIDGLAEAISVRIKQLRQRAARLDGQAKDIRSAIEETLGLCGLRKLELGTATVSLGAGRPVVVITDASSIPQQWMRRQDPVPDKEAILKILLSGGVVPGAELGSAGVGLRVYRS
jgi:hypothetical protein